MVRKSADAGGSRGWRWVLRISGVGVIEAAEGEWAMAQHGGVMPGTTSTGPAGGAALSWVPLIVSALVVAHLFALAYWIYKLASDKPEERKKVH